MYCKSCGKELKAAARFCHECGAAVSGKQQPEESQLTPADPRNWLQSFGAFLLIPIFVVIIVLLFWSNPDPENTTATQGTESSAQKQPDMAAMAQIHSTLERLKERVATNTKDIEAIDSLAVMFSIANNFEKSKAYYEMHLAIEPDNKDIKIALALTYHNLTDNEKAISLIKEVLDKEPEYVFALHYMAALLDAGHKHDEAKTYWKKIVENNPGTDFAKMASEKLAEAEHKHDASQP